MSNYHTKKTMLKNVMKNFNPTEIDLANVIMQRMGSWDTRKAFANDVKALYLYAARDALDYIEKTFELTQRIQ